MTDLFLSVTPPSNGGNATETLIGAFCIIFAILLFMFIVAVAVPSPHDKTPSQKSETQTQPTEQNAVPVKKKHPVLKVSLVLLVIASVIFGVVCCSNYFRSGNGSFNMDKLLPLSRNAHNNDITVSDTKLNWSDLGQEFIFIAEENIKDLQLTLNFYDKNKNLVSTKTKDFSSVKKGNEYTIFIGITDFSLADHLKINSVTIEVTKGTVSLL